MIVLAFAPEALVHPSFQRLVHPVFPSSENVKKAT
jgi:hypothetical protein